MSKAVNEPILNVNNLTKIYGWELTIGSKKIGRRVVGTQEATFSVRKGEIFGFLGPNGAGKTTTMRAILDYLHLKSGTVTFFGNLDHHKNALDIRRRIGYVPGDVALYKNMSGNDLIKYFGQFRQINQDFLTQLRKIFRVNLTLKIGQLSKGNRQQAALIVALASKPEFLILDEPTSGLDPLMTSNFHKILKKLTKEGITIFLSSHDLAEVQAVCDRVGIIKNGKIILVEAVEDLRNKFLQNVRVTFLDEKNMPTEDEINKIRSVTSAKRIKKRTFTLTIEEDVNEFLLFLTKYRIKRVSHYYE
jgi:ABC-2 type transport system ATP-binding protein